MVRDFRGEAFDIIAAAVSASEAVHMNAVIEDCAVAVGKRLKADDIRSRNFEMMLMRVIRKIRSAKNVADLQELADKAGSLVTRLGTGGITR